MNQHYFDVPFAFSGDVTPIPDPLQSGGTVSFTEGWNYNYQRDLTTDPLALPIDRSTMNWLFLQITKAIAALQSETIPEFITASQNGGVALSYGPQSQVLWSVSGNAPFTKFVNISGAANTNTPALSDPTGATTGWQISCDPIATSAQAAAGTNNASIMTPLLVAQQTALRALLAGNAGQVFNVAPGTALTHAAQISQLGPRNILVFTSNGTFNVPTNVTQVKIRVWGAGGAGGSSSNVGFPGGGGGGGAYAEGVYTVTPGAAIGVVVGTGVVGGAGNPSNVGTLISVAGGGFGGNGVAGAVGTGGHGATASTGAALTVPGGDGSNGIIYGSSGAVEGGTGNGAFGSTAVRAVGSSSGAFSGTAGAFPGGGASGGTGTSIAGANGLVVIEW